MKQAMLVACLLYLMGSAVASAGDRSVAFRRCHGLCTRTGCGSVPAATPHTKGHAQGSSSAADVRTGCSPLCARSPPASQAEAWPAAPISLQLLRWDCNADCSYICMWLLEDSSRSLGGAVQKYYGKWPFTRLLGMQEPAAVLFSLLNLAAHLHCLVRFTRLTRSLSVQPAGGGACLGSGFTHRWLWTGYMSLSINAWLWSAVFHSRDTWLTERLDYFSAALLIFFNLFLSAARTCNLGGGGMVAVGAPLAAFLASHLRYMHAVLFDYGYHVQVCLAAGAVQSLLWVVWTAITAPAGRRHLVAFVALVNACMLLEILDFPPFNDVLDAHALWHACTVPLVYLFYVFIATDAQPPDSLVKQKHT